MRQFEDSMKEIHVYTTNNYPSETIVNYFDSILAIDKLDIIHTTQTALLNFYYTELGYDLYCHLPTYKIQIKISDNDWTDKNIMRHHNIERLIRANGMFSFEKVEPNLLADKSINVYLTSNHQVDIITNLLDLKIAIALDVKCIHTTQLIGLNTDYILRGYKIYCHLPDKVIECKLGINEWLDKELVYAHNLEKIIKRLCDSYLFV